MEKSFEQLKNEGYACLNRRERKEAHKIFSTMIKLEPNNPEGYRGRAMALDMYELPDSAILDQIKVTELCPEDAWEWYVLYILYDKTEQDDKANACYNRAKQINPELRVFYRKFIWDYIKAGERERANIV